MNYEVSHVYMDGDIGKEQIRGIQIFNSLRTKEDEASLMIDDYSLKHGGQNLIGKKDIVDFYAKHLTLSDIKMESEFVDIASMLPDFIETKRETFRKDKKTVLFMVIEGHKIKLRDEYQDGTVKYSCPSLSASFHLFRAGMIEGNKIVKQKKEIASILPNEYVYVEKQVKLILDRFQCINKYIFY